mgnify:FL=1
MAPSKLSPLSKIFYKENYQVSNNAEIATVRIQNVLSFTVNALQQVSTVLAAIVLIAKTICNTKKREEWQ